MVQRVVRLAQRLAGTQEHLVTVINERGQPGHQAVRPIKIYGERLPDYLRLDMRVTRNWPTRWGGSAPRWK